MSGTGPTPNASAERFLAERRARLGRLVGRHLVPQRLTSMAADRRRFLLEEAEELYWNELEWEKLTADEGVELGGLVELTFPGFLAFIEGLLLREVMPDSQAPASPRPEVVEDILHFLAGRCLELAEGTDAQSRLDRAMTLRLIDLTLYRLHELPTGATERIELASVDEDD